MDKHTSDKVYANSTHRWKFQQRPLVPLAPVYHANTITTTTKFNTMAVQTQFRESEAQTDPFSAPLQVQDPSLIAIQDLKWGKGLPATAEEYDYIKRSLEKQAKLQNLPSDLNARLKVMRELEVEETFQRVKQHDRLISQKIELLSEDIQKRHEERLQKMNQRMEEYERSRLKEFEKTRAALARRQHQAMVSILEKTRYEETSILNKRIEAYRKTLLNSATMSKKNISKALPLLDDETGEPPQKRESKVDRLLKPTEFSYRLQTEKRWQRKLQNLSFKPDLKTKDEKPLKFLLQKEKKEARAETPIEQRGELEDEMDISAVLIQRILRGLYDQHLMQTGIGARRELLDELEVRRAGGTLQSIDFLDKSLVISTDSVSAEEKPSGLTNRKELKDRFQELLLSQFIGRSLDFLAKDLVRKRQFGEIISFRSAAQNDRSKREQEELYRRSQDLQTRAIIDFVHGELTDVNRSCSDSLITDCLRNSIDFVSIHESYENAKDCTDYSKVDNTPGHVVGDILGFLRQETLKNQEGISLEKVRKFVVSSLRDDLLK